MLNIKSLKAVSILDSRGQPTVLVHVVTTDGRVDASVPRGKSKGKYEVHDISDNGIKYSIDFINKLSAKVRGMKFEKFDDIKQVSSLVRQYDKTKELRLVGGNSLLAIEIAIAKAIALHNKLPLWKFIADSFGIKPRIMPIPLGNCIGGGKHSPKAVKPDIQEFLLWPKSKTFSDGFSLNLQVYRKVEQILSKYKYKVDVTDEKAFCPSMDNVKVFELLKHVQEFMKKTFNRQIDFGVDIAASSLWNGFTYSYKNFPSRQDLTKEQQLKFVSELIKKFGIRYVEDPFIEDDFDSFSKLNHQFSKNVLIVGDDLIATNPKRLEKAIKMKAINAVIVKPNQAGSLFKAKQVIDMARRHNITPVMSHRSAETLDDWLADFTVGWQVPMLKAGITGKERLAKLLRLVRIERMMKKYK